MSPIKFRPSNLSHFSLQIFQTLEHPLEIQMLDETRARLNAERDLFMRFVFNGSWNSVTHRHNIDQVRLKSK